MYTNHPWYQPNMINSLVSPWLSPPSVPPVDPLKNRLALVYRTPLQAYDNMANSLSHIVKLDPSYKNAKCQTTPASYSIIEKTGSCCESISPISTCDSPKCIPVVLYNWTPINFKDDGTCCVIGFLKDTKYLALSAAISSVTEGGKIVWDGQKQYKLSGSMCWKLYQSIHPEHKKISLPRDLFSAFQHGFPQHSYRGWALGIFFLLHQEENDDHIQPSFLLSEENSPRSLLKSCNSESDILVNCLSSNRIIERKSAAKVLTESAVPAKNGHFANDAPVMRLERVSKNRRPRDFDSSVSGDSIKLEEKNGNKISIHRSNANKNAQKKLSDRMEKFSKEYRIIFENDRLNSLTEKKPDLVTTPTFDRNLRLRRDSRLNSTPRHSGQSRCYISQSNKKKQHRQKSPSLESNTDISTSSFENSSVKSSISSRETRIDSVPQNRRVVRSSKKSQTEIISSGARQCLLTKSPVLVSHDENSMNVDEVESKRIKSSHKRHVGEYSRKLRRKDKHEKFPNFDSTSQDSSSIDEARPLGRSFREEVKKSRCKENLSTGSSFHEDVDRKERKKKSHLKADRFLIKPKTSIKYKPSTSNGVLPDVGYPKRTRSGRLSLPCNDFYERQKILLNSSYFSIGE